MRVGIVGATGYVGMELARLLCRRESVVLTRMISQSYTGEKYSSVYPAFTGILDMELTALDPDDLAGSCDLVITALPHGVSAEVVPQLLERGLKVIDHSGDFRYRSAAIYESAYKLHHPRPDLLEQAVYGLPEIYRQEIAAARLVANPGCYPTCSLLALMPALRSKLISFSGIIIDAVSGVSGAGRKAALPFSFCETTENFKPYAAIGHRHTSEIEQEAALMAGQPQMALTFTPHLAPLKRGMLATIYADLRPGIEAKQIFGAYEAAYADEEFVRILPEGSLPETRHVNGSNYCHIGLAPDSRTGKLKIMSAIDNLGKGAAAQAVQSLNLMAGLPEQDGLAGLVDPL